jgi:hydroxylamine reductase (hybrid-cluster protein)
VGEKSVDQASLKMLNKAAQEGIETAWDRYEKQQPQCGFGLLGICCRNCNMGPCRIDPFGDEPQEGVCGATADTIAARNLLRMIAAGAAAHSDHGRDIVTTLYETAAGETQGSIQAISPQKIAMRRFPVNKINNKGKPTVRTRIRNRNSSPLKGKSAWASLSSTRSESLNAAKNLPPQRSKDLPISFFSPGTLLLSGGFCLV